MQCRDDPAMMKWSLATKERKLEVVTIWKWSLAIKGNKSILGSTSAWTQHWHGITANPYISSCTIRLSL